MSDITKKIYSIEQAAEAATDDIVRSVSGKTDKPALRPTPPEDVPAFVTREAPKRVLPGLDLPPPEMGKGWILWTGLLFSALWLVGAGLYFIPNVLRESANLLSLSGLIVLMLLPVILITLLWVALRRLVDITNMNNRMSVAANALVSPETEVLERTQFLSGAIRVEISKVNTQLADTVKALQGVQTAIARESQALDTTGHKLARRSEDVGQNLGKHRQTLETFSGDFEAKLGALSARITETGNDLDTTSTTVQGKINEVIRSLSKTTEALSAASGSTDETLTQKIMELSEASQKISSAGEFLKSELETSGGKLVSLEKNIIGQAVELSQMNMTTEGQLSGLESTIEKGQSLLRGLEAISLKTDGDLKNLYDRLSQQMKQSEDQMLATQGRTARMVEGNLAQIRRDFGRMETELQALQTRLNNMRDTTEELPLNKPASNRLSLKPLETDFPPVEPPKDIEVKRPPEPSQKPFDRIQEEPLNLGADMQLENPDEALTNFNPDVLRRPGVVSAPSGFGRKKMAKDKDRSAWHWRDMLGGLEPPDADVETDNLVKPSYTFDIVGALNAIQLSPAAIVDDGAIIDATQARINGGEAGLAKKVADKLADPAAHLSSKMQQDPELAQNIEHFTEDFARKVGSTPPSAPALRAVFSSPKGRAYLLCAAALKT